MSFLVVTIPVSLLVAAVMLVLVIRAVQNGGFDDWEGPSARLLHDADSVPELPDDGRDPPGDESSARESGPRPGL